MFNEAAAFLENTGLAAFLRGSVWAYPLVNTGHIAGVALLVGGAAPFCLRLLGFWKTVPLPALRRVLARTSDAGLALAAVCGFLLFICRAGAYLHSAVFLLKMALLVAGISGTIVLRRLTAGRAAGGATPVAHRAAAGVTLSLWTAVLVTGRLIGYL